VSLLPAGIHLNSINFSRNQIYNNNAGILIAVSGIAQNRDSLASFVSALRDSGSFSSVDLPVSDLAKGDNLPFSIQIFIKN
jgi:Tfp pilus assembly protein PilN